MKRVGVNNTFTWSNPMALISWTSAVVIMRAVDRDLGFGCVLSMDIPRFNFSLGVEGSSAVPGGLMSVTS